MGLFSTVKHATIYGATLLLGVMFAIGPFMELVQRCCRRKNPATMPKERTCEGEFRSLSCGTSAVSGLWWLIDQPGQSCAMFNLECWDVMTKIVQIRRSWMIRCGASTSQ
jgi:hypothetical protein